MPKVENEDIIQNYRFDFDDFEEESAVDDLEQLKLRQIEDVFDEAKRWLDEAKELIQQNTIDSLLRYFQTGIVQGAHLPSLLLKNEKEIERILAGKLEYIIKKLGLRWNEVELRRRGKMLLEYVQDDYTLQFATINPYERAIVFHFDFGEMEREREIELSKIKHKIKETMERYKDTKRYLEDNKGLKKLRHRKAIERLENNQKKIGEEIVELEEQIKEINKQKELLEVIKQKVPDMEYYFRRFGFVFEFVKGEQYEV